jgi:hypothetical protein
MDLDLRPLGIGEILDRAVTLFVRRFAVLVLILALVAVPIAIVQYAAAPSTAGLLADIGRVLSVPPGHTQEQAAILRQISARNRTGGFGLVLVVVSAVLSSLSTTACIMGVAQAYAGKLPSVREVYREALRRWLPQLAAVVAFVGIAFLLAVVMAIVVFCVALAVAALASVSRVAATLVGIPLGLVVVVAFLGALILLYFVAQMTLVSIALEDPNPFRGMALGLRRTLSPALFWRSVLVGTVAFAVSLIGSVVLISLAATLSALTHLSALYPVIAVVGGVALNALLTTFIVIYAFDVRVRREGYDLALAAQATPL